MSTFSLIFAIVLPLLGGIVLAASPALNQERKTRNIFVCAILVIELLFCAMAAIFSDGKIVLLFRFSEALPIALKADSLSLIFSNVMAWMWCISGFLSFEYMSHEKNEREYYAFYLLTLSSLIALSFSATLVTMYLFFEAVTFLSLAFVLHTRSKEAIASGIKYLIYSIAGATMGLLAIFFLARNTSTPYFVLGGALNANLSVSSDTLLKILFISIIGFSTKAGMFPMHGWLPSAHPVAPAPASAVLSGVITKAGVLCVIRLIYYSVGPNFLRSTWVQAALISLSLITIFMGSVMALNEKLMKKRLAYSSVSQLSYILCGIFLMDASAVEGSFLHLVYHAIIKNGLFLCAGVIIYKTGIKSVDEYNGLGKRMPFVMTCFTILSLGLIGIPPTGGFVSKWYIAEGALIHPYFEVFTWLVPVILLISALLTAAYLLPPSIHAFFYSSDTQLCDLRCRKNIYIALPLTLLSVAIVVFGIIPTPFIRVFESLAKLMN